MSCYDEIGSRRLDSWDEDNLSLALLRYKPSNSDATDQASQFILGFKNFDLSCVQVAMMQVYDAVRRFSEDWRRDFGCRYIVPVPSHAALQVAQPSKMVCHFIASMFPWLQYPEQLLFRKRSVLAAHMARFSGERPTANEHFESLGCKKTDLAGAGIILFDDVRTTGSTSQGCRWRLQQDTGCGDVVRVFLGKTG